MAGESPLATAFGKAKSLTAPRRSAANSDDFGPAGCEASSQAFPYKAVFRFSRARTTKVMSFTPRMLQGSTATPQEYQSKAKARGMKGKRRTQDSGRRTQ